LNLGGCEVLTSTRAQVYLPDIEEDGVPTEGAVYRKGMQGWRVNLVSVANRQGAVAIACAGVLPASDGEGCEE